MRLKTFAAQTLTQAMADVRREMGAEAVIIATSDGPNGGVQVRAASEMAYHPDAGIAKMNISTRLSARWASTAHPAQQPNR